MINETDRQTDRQTETETQRENTDFYRQEVDFVDDDSMARDIGQYRLKDVTLLTTGFPPSSVQIGSTVEVEELKWFAHAQRLAGDVVDGVKASGIHRNGIYGALLGVVGDGVLNP